MSPVSFRRFVVKAFDYEEWAIVILAATAEDAIRKAQAIYDADRFSITDGYELCWKAQPLTTKLGR